MRVGWAVLNWLADLLGAAAVLVLTWLLFPAVVTLVMGFFLDRIAAAVEAPIIRDAGRRAAPVPRLIAATLRLMGLTIAAQPVGACRFTCWSPG